MILGDLIGNKNIVFLNEKLSRKEVIFSLSNEAEKLGKVNSGQKFAESVFGREQIISTGIGLGIAIPHSKLPDIKDFFVVVGVLKDYTEWDSIDKKPVKAVFLIGGPDNNQKKYLKVLSKLMLLIKNSSIRDKIFTADNPDIIVKQFSKF